MDRGDEIKSIENILRTSEEFKKLDETSILTWKKYYFIYKNQKNLNYFKFIPKTNTYNSRDFLELAIELKGLEKSYNLKNFIFGTSLFYFLLILDKTPKYLSFRTIGKFLFVGTYLVIKNLENQLVYLRIMNQIYRPEFIHLKEKLEHDKNGWDQEVTKGYI